MSAHVCLIVGVEPEARRFLRAVLTKEKIHCLEVDNAVHASKIVRKSFSDSDGT